MISRLILLPFLLLFCASTLQAQNELDALRQAQHGHGIGARAIAIGPAYSAISDDYAAVFFNPAGLGQIKRFEATLGFDFFQYSADALYLDVSNTATNSGNALNSIGLVVPFPTYQGSFVVAAGYNRLRNFRAAQNATAFNPSGSISDWFLSFTPRFDSQQRILLDDVGALAFNHFLINDRNGQYVDPIINRGQVLQRSNLLEDGGANAFSISAAIEVAPALFVGATLNLISSRYTFSRNFTESDENNIYPNFLSLTLSEEFETDASGWNIKAGLLYRADNNWRFGLTLETPLLLELKDRFSTSLQTRYERPPDGATRAVFNDALPTSNIEYRLQTPWVFGISLSFEESFFTLGTEFNYRDWTQLSYSSDAISFADINRVIASELQGAFGASIGLEARPLSLPLRLRAGYTIQQTPFRYRLSDNPNERLSTSLADARQTLSFGAGFLFQQTLSIDIAYLFSTQNMQGRLYSGSRVVNETVRNSNIVFTASFRF
ncbi:MAG: OmpP1/FadL family transporter [Candidatus Thermochlorobacter sp.]